MLLIDKSKQDVLSLALRRMEENTTITGVQPGDVAERFLNIISEILTDEEEGFYPLLKLAHMNSFLSTAGGGALDLIGMLLACKRNDGESDDEYRTRISKQVLIVANANETAIRMAALSVKEVKDVRLLPYTHGTGSFSVYVITDDPYGGEDILEQVRSNIDKVKAFGVRVSVFKPEVIPVEVHAQLVYDKSVSDGEQIMIAAQVEELLRNYINSRYPGEMLVMNEMIELAMKSDTRIFDMKIAKMTIKRRAAIITNQKSKWNERFFEAQTAGAIRVR